MALVAFVSGCFAMTVYMWIEFGGPLPLKPEAYRMEVALDDARGLVRNTNVRIAGVNIGKVRSVELDEETNQTVAELEIDSEFSPRPVDTQVTLRQRSLLGETYVELSPGSQDAPDVPEGGRLPPGQIEESVSLEDVLGTFDEPTRQALTSWLTEQGAALSGQAPSVSATLSALHPFSVNTGEALEVVREEQVASASLIRDGGSALTALTERQGQFQALVENSARTFRAVGARNAEVADAIRILPTLIDETRITSERFARFSDETTPLVKQLQPAATELSPALKDLHRFAPELRRLMRGIKPLTKSSRKGVPALNVVLNQLVPLFDRSRPWLGELIPVIDYADAYRAEIAGAAANLAATTQVSQTPPGGGGLLHYARGAVPVGLESLAAFPERFGTSRSNPYPAPGQGLDLAAGLPQFGDYLCVNRALPSKSPAFSPAISDAIDLYLTDVPADPGPVDPPSPPCRSQPALGPLLNAGSGLFPQLRLLP